MDTVNVQQSQQLQLDDGQQQRIVNYVVQTWDKGKKERKKRERTWETAQKAYDCEYDPVKDSRLAWKSQVYLPWAFDSLESWYAYMHTMLLPRDESFFTLNARMQSDHKGADVMERYLQHTFNVNGMTEKFGAYLKQLGLKGASAMKVYWREDRRQVTQWQPQAVTDPVTGEMVIDSESGTVLMQHSPVQGEITVLNNAWFDVIDMENFVFFPLDGDFEKTTRIHQTYKFLEELEDLVQNGEAPYFNLDKVAQSSKTSSSEDLWDKGVKLKEAWIHRAKIEGKVYRNYIATIADDKTLIRFQPNSLDLGRSAFIFTSLISSGCNQLLGSGLLDKAISVHKAANFLTNARLNEIKLKIYGNYKYVEDDVFDPYNFITRPGGLTKVGSLDNLVPINPNLEGVQVSYTEVSEMKMEYEEVTVPKIVKGQIDEGDPTATETNLAHNGASGKMNVQAQRINECGLKPLIEMTYLLIYQKLQSDPRIREDIARITQQPTQEIAQAPDGTPLPQPVEVPISMEQLVQELPQIIPLPEIDIQIIGYQNQLKKQQTIQGLQMIGQNIINTPAAAYFKWLDSFKLGARMLGLPESELFVSDKEKEQIDQQQAQQAQAQQEAMAMQQQAQQQQIQVQQAEHQAQIQLYASKEQNQSDRLQLDALKLAMESQQNQNEPKTEGTSK